MTTTTSTTASATTPTPEQFSIVVPKWIDASPEDVFDAWAEPALFKQWFDTHESILAKAAVGNLWYWAHKTPSGRIIAHYSRYLRVERGTLLEFTWISAPTKGVETHVTLEFKPSKGGTDLVLTHRGFIDVDSASGHEKGWTSFANDLAARIKNVKKG